MTSRLKRKLNDLGVDTASSKANESFCLIGTPLPPLEKSKDTGEFVPLWKQEVRDEKGRRRLHGAFTGGFSAGYFNTVGSAEGWAPSTFVSSRADRAKKKAARPEDFMDEEDLAEMRESRKLVDEHEEMDFGGTAAERRRKAGDEELEKDPITAALEASLAPSPKDSIGARILKKMGWRMGQGIGPRLTYAQRKAQDAGIFDPSKEVDGDEEDIEEAKKHTYPRRDTPVLVAPRKDNFHGLGYNPGLGLSESVGHGPNSAKADAGPRLAAGFGLGALNDADDDDIDVYDGGARGRGGTRMAYDQSLDEDDHLMSIGSKQSKKPQLGRDPAVNQTETFNDGTPVLKGFVLSDKPVSEDRWYPLPDIPPGWKPDPRRVWDKENQAASQRQARPQPTTHTEWKSNLMSADERGAILGETPLPQQPRSVFDFMSQKDRERLQNIRNNASAPPPRAPSPSRPAPAAAPTPGGIRIPDLHPSVAKAALTGFQPFPADPVKQARYTAFLTFLSNNPDPHAHIGALGMGPHPGQSADEFNKELDDYAKAATVFKPLSGAMAGRFRSAAIVETAPAVVEGLHRPVPKEEPPAEEEEAREEVDRDPKTNAARLGMYGPLTREAKPWQPARLLCKRFGVKDPEVDMTAAAGEASSDFQFATGAAAAAKDAAAAPPPLAITAGTEREEEQPASGGRSGPRNLANVGLGEDETQGRDILTYQRPAMDVFKAIFASDDEGSDDEAEGAAEPAIPPVAVAKAVHVDEAKASPPPPAPVTTAPEVVDLASFKPTFVPRAQRESRRDKDADGKAREKERKSKEKEKKKAKALMSFAEEDDGSAPSFGPAREKERARKKKKRKEQHTPAEDADDDSMWVEKPAPDVVKGLAAAAMPTRDAPERTSMDVDDTPAGPPRGRKRAVDFM